jgi:hypothetical protein
VNGQDSQPEIFDVFLCHNSEDKPEVRVIAEMLVKEGIKPWLDEADISVGGFWHSNIGGQIETAKSAAVFVGRSGIGPWQKREIQALLSQFVRRKCPVIPVILPSVTKTLEMPWVLEGLHLIDFRTDPQALEQLIWGITGKKPSKYRPVVATRIFICYRQFDSAGHAGRLFDTLSGKFGREQIFMDVAGVEPGADFVEVIEMSVISCHVLLAVIGRNWLTYKEGSKRKRRLDDPNDFVRLEIRTGLERDIRTIPVLVQGAEMPLVHSLPEEIKKLTRRQAFELRDSRWDYDVAALISSLETTPSWKDRQRQEAERMRETLERMGWKVIPKEAELRRGRM